MYVLEEHQLARLKSLTRQLFDDSGKPAGERRDIANAIQLVIWDLENQKIAAVEYEGFDGKPALTD